MAFVEMVFVAFDETIFVAMVFVERQNGLRRTGLRRIVSDETIFVALVFVERQNGLRRNGLRRISLR